MQENKRDTIFSPERRYRYTLWREWDVDEATGCADDNPRSHQYLMVIGLNPSTADETKNDPTVAKCIRYAKRWGFGGLCMTNLFAFRATMPEKMKREPNPIGPENDRWLTEIASGAGMILAAWGNHGTHMSRDGQVVAMLRPQGPRLLHCLKLTATGQPWHPLYVKDDQEPKTFR